MIFTQNNIKEFFKERKNWKIEHEFIEENKTTHSIGIRVKHKNKYALSIVAGTFLYSIPRTLATEFIQVEIALINPKGEIDYNKKHKKYFNEDVAGYTDFKGFIARVKYVETLKGE